MIYRKHRFKWENRESQKIFQSLIGFPSQKVSRDEVAAILRCANIKPKSKILDVGCGTGRHAAILTKKGFNVVGIDVAPYFLRQAKVYAKSVGATASFRQQKASNIHRRNYYDLILAFDWTPGLMDVTELQESFRAIFAALKPGSKFILKSAGPNTQRGVANRCRLRRVGNCYVMERQQIVGRRRHEICLVIDFNKAKIDEFEEWHRIYSRSEICGYLNKAGFEVLDKETITIGTRTGSSGWSTYVCLKPNPSATSNRV